ncbi:MAG: flagellar motor switch protein FliN [Candidatus Dadabacteria bacterium]|nr:MAG: flagellar motor switch protein FliN [Candidatus Dadabacteria bacterium]
MADEEVQENSETPEAGAEGSEEVKEGLEQVASAAEEVADAASEAAAAPKQGSRTFDFIMEVGLQVTVEVGRARMTIQDLLQLGQGSVVELEKMAGEPLDVYINGRKVGKGEAVIVNEKFGVRLTEIISKQDRVESLG